MKKGKWIQALLQKDSLEVVHITVVVKHESENTGFSWYLNLNSFLGIRENYSREIIMMTIGQAKI